MFKTSTQKMHWTFTPSQLRQLRVETSKSHLHHLPIGNGDDNQINSDTNNEFLSDEEELALVQSAANQVAALASRFKCDEAKYTAIVFLKRYYLNNCVLNINPTEIGLGCLMLASKVEEVAFDVYNKGFTQLLEKLPGLTSETVYERLFELELEVLQGIGFYLKIYLPFRPLIGFVCEIQEKYAAILDASEADILIQIQQEGNRLLESAILNTDACFLVFPSHLALAALMKISGTVKDGVLKDLVMKYIDSDADLSRVCRKIIDEHVDAYFENGPHTFVPATKQTIEKCKRLRNPLYIPGTKEFIEARELKKKKTLEKYQMKTQKILSQQDEMCANLCVSKI